MKTHTEITLIAIHHRLEGGLAALETAVRTLIEGTDEQNRAVELFEKSLLNLKQITASLSPSRDTEPKEIAS